MMAAKELGRYTAEESSMEDKDGLSYRLELNQLRRENTRLQNDLTRALDGRQHLPHKSNTQDTRKESKGSKILEKRLTAVRAELDTLKRKNTGLTKEKDGLEQKADLLEGRLQDAAQVPVMFLARLEEITQMGENPKSPATPTPALGEYATDLLIDRFNEAIESLWQLVDKRHILQNRILRDESSELKEALDNKESSIIELREDGRRLEKELAELQALLEEAQSNIRLRDDRLSELRTKLGELEEANKKLTSSNLELKSLVKDLRSCVDPAVYQHFAGSDNSAEKFPLDRRSGWSPVASAVVGMAFGVLVAIGADWLYWGQAPTMLSFHNLDSWLSNSMSVQSKELSAKSTAIGSTTLLRAGVSLADPLPEGGTGPRMIYLAGGNFTMGTDRHWVPKNEQPARAVRVKSFYLSEHEVTFRDYDKFVRATGRVAPLDQGWGRDQRPVINVSWHDAQAYTQWLSKKTGHRYRLPSEAEWEYGIAGGFQGIYWWGNGLEPGREVCFNCGTIWDGTKTAPVASTTANPFGLYDMGGNVMEWVSDCVELSTDAADCTLRSVRGGAFNKPDDTVRTTARRALASDLTYPMVGFRLVREP